MAAKKRPFFSLVIPCYNDGRYAPGMYIDRLLTSVEVQGLKKSDIEVIVVDDHSPMPFDATITRHKKKLNIRTIQTDYNCCPGNSREKGAAVATGEWLCFADHDDAFYPDAFKNVMNIIASSKECYLVISDFNKVAMRDETQIVEEFRKPHLKTWIHGKFYNLDNLWRAQDIHFIKDLKTHEDIALGNLIECALRKIGKTDCAYITQPTYMWTDNPNSTSNSNYVSKDGHPFIELYFSDLVTSTAEPYLIAYNKDEITKDDATVMTLAQLANCWILLTRFRDQNPETYFANNEGYCARLWHSMKDTLGLSPAQVKVLVATTLSTVKATIDKVVATHPNSLNFAQWIDHLDTLDYKPMIDAADADRIRREQSNKQEYCLTLLPDRPFFSIVIPCYNDGRYAKGNYLDRLLTSICKQGLNKSEIEVIISDDHSPVPYDSIVAEYEDKLTIKRIVTDYNFAPGNTRAKGVTIATGQWLAFADHDDIYYDDALRKVKEGLIQRQEKYYALGDFYGVDSEGKVLRKFEKTMNWCHAKFYNVDNFWKPQNIHFIKDLKSHEDIAICTQVACALHALNVENYTYFHFPVYAWTDNPQSVSHAKYTVDTETGPREFLEVFFDDYLHSTGYLYIDEFKSHRIKMLFAVKGVLEIICYAYFYMQGFQFRRPGDFYRKNFAYAGEYIRKCKETFNLTTDTIYNAVSSNNAAMYYQIRNLADPGSGRYMISQTFRDWLVIVSNSYLDN